MENIRQTNERAREFIVVTVGRNWLLSNRNLFPFQLEFEREEIYDRENRIEGRISCPTQPLMAIIN